MKKIMELNKENAFEALVRIQDEGANRVCIQDNNLEIQTPLYVDTDENKAKLESVKASLQRYLESDNATLDVYFHESKQNFKANVTINAVSDVEYVNISPVPVEEEKPKKAPRKRSPRKKEEV